MAHLQGETNHVELETIKLEYGLSVFKTETKKPTMGKLAHIYKELHPSLLTTEMCRPEPQIKTTGIATKSATAASKSNELFSTSCNHDHDPTGQLLPLQQSLTQKRSRAKSTLVEHPSDHIKATTICTGVDNLRGTGGWVDDSPGLKSESSRFFENTIFNDPAALFRAPQGQLQVYTINALRQTTQ